MGPICANYLVQTEKERSELESQIKLLDDYYALHVNPLADKSIDNSVVIVMQRESNNYVECVITPFPDFELSMSTLDNKFEPAILISSDAERCSFQIGSSNYSVYYKYTQK